MRARFLLWSPANPEVRTLVNLSRPVRLHRRFLFAFAPLSIEVGIRLEKCLFLIGMGCLITDVGSGKGMRSSSPRFTMAVHRVEAGDGDGDGEPQTLWR
jgi:hypothetical protein